MGARLSLLNPKKREDTGERTRNHPRQENRNLLDRQAGPPFCTTPSQYFAAVLCAHSLPKTVLALALQFRWLLIRKRHEAPLRTSYGRPCIKRRWHYMDHCRGCQFTKGRLEQAADYPQLNPRRTRTLPCFGALLPGRRQVATGIPNQIPGLDSRKIWIYNKLRRHHTMLNRWHRDCQGLRVSHMLMKHFPE
jgi:hypothetical protein